jgi:hypothetical protein
MLSAAVSVKGLWGFYEMAVSMSPVKRLHIDAVCDMIVVEVRPHWVDSHRRE